MAVAEIPVSSHQAGTGTQELRNLCVWKQASTPSSPQEAVFWYNTNAIDRRLYFHDSVAAVPVPRLDRSEGVSAQWTFAPTSPAAPFALNANAQGRKVIGLNADLLDGYDASELSTGLTVAVRNVNGRLVVADPAFSNEAVPLGYLTTALSTVTIDASQIVSGLVPLVRGGTGANLSTAANGAFIYKVSSTALAGSAALTGVVIGNGAGAPTAQMPLTVAYGGTNAITAAGARNNLDVLWADDARALVSMRVPRGGVRLQGTGAGGSITGPTGSGLALGLNDFSLSFVLRMESYLVQQDFFYSHSSGTSRFFCGGQSNGNFQISFQNSGGGISTYAMNPDVPLVAGKTYHFVLSVVRNGLATLYINGNSDRNQDATSVNISVAASASVDIGASNTAGFFLGYNVKGNLYSFAIFNRALSASDAMNLIETGGVDFSDEWGAYTAIYTSDFSVGTDTWTAVAGTIAGNVDGIAGKDNNQRFTCDTANSGHYSVINNPSILAGRRYRVTGEVYIPSSNAVLKRVAPSFKNPGDMGVIISTPDTWVAFTGEEVTNGTFLRLYSADASSLIAYVGNGTDIFYARNIQVVPIGAILDLDLEYADTAKTTAVKDRSSSALHSTSSATNNQVKQIPQLNATTALLSSITVNQVLYGGTGGLLTGLAVNAGAINFLSQTSSAAPVWTNLAASNVTWTGTHTFSNAPIISTLTTNQVLYAGASKEIVGVGLNAGTVQFLTQATSLAPGWTNLFANTNTWTATNTFPALNVTGLTTNAVVYSAAGGALTSVALNTSTTRFLTQASSGAPVWTDLYASNITWTGQHTFPFGFPPILSNLSPNEVLCANASQQIVGIARNTAGTIYYLGQFSSGVPGFVNLYALGNTWTGTNAFTGTINVPTPTTGANATTKDYVDAAVSAAAAGLRPMASCNLATIANITLSGEQPIDGVTTSNSRVLVKDQTTASQNGVYISGSGAWTRATDGDTAAELTKGAYTFVTQGAANIGTSWFQTATVTTLGTDAVTWVKFFQQAAISAGVGISITGQTISVDQSFSPTWTGLHTFTQAPRVNTLIVNQVLVAGGSGAIAGIAMPGTAPRSFLTQSGTAAPAWYDLFGTSATFTAAATVTFTNAPLVSSLAQFQVVYAGPSGALTGVPVSTGTGSGYFLVQSVASNPAWFNLFGSNINWTGTHSFSNAPLISTLLQNQVLYASATSAVTGLAVNSTATTKFLTQTSSGVPAWFDLFATNCAWTGAHTLTNASGFSFMPWGVGSGNTSPLRFFELTASGSNYVAFKAPDSIPSDTTWTLPNADGGANYVLKTNGAGVLAFALITDLISLSGFVTSVSGTPNRITVTGTAAVTVDIALTYAGQISITTLGTVTTGTWNATAIGATFGGTGRTTWTAGDLVYSPSANTLGGLPVGATSRFLTSTGTVPVWSGYALPATVAANQLLYATSTTAVVGLTSVANRILMTDGTGVIAWSNSLPTGLTIAGDAFSGVAKIRWFAVGDGVTTSITLTHNFGTQDVVVQVYDASTKQLVLVSSVRSTVNTVVLEFVVAPGASAYRAAVIAAI